LKYVCSSIRAPVSSRLKRSPTQSYARSECASPWKSSIRHALPLPRRCVSASAWHTVTTASSCCRVSAPASEAVRFSCSDVTRSSTVRIGFTWIVRKRTARRAEETPGTTEGILGKREQIIKPGVSNPEDCAAIVPCHGRGEYPPIRRYTEPCSPAQLLGMMIPAANVNNGRRTAP
jgi:hypothetical protein